MRKNLLQRFIDGFKLGLKDNFLPSHILVFHQSKIYLVFKYSGLMSISLVLSGILPRYSIILYYLIFLYSLIWICYRYYIIFLELTEFLKKIYRGELTIRNSPLDAAGTFARIMTLGLKKGMNGVIGAGLSFTLAKELDDILVENKREPIFIPWLKSFVSSMPQGDSLLDKVLNKLGAVKKSAEESSDEASGSNTGRLSLDSDVVKTEVSKELDIPLSDIQKADEVWNTLNKEEKVQFTSKILEELELSKAKSTAGTSKSKD